MLSKKGVAREIAQHLILEFHGLLIIDLFHAHLNSMMVWLGILVPCEIAVKNDGNAMI